MSDYVYQTEREKIKDLEHIEEIFGDALTQISQLESAKQDEALMIAKIALDRVEKLYG